MGDATSRLLLKQCMRETSASFLGMSPPCKENSQARQRGQAQDPDLLKETRAVCQSLGCLYHIENVIGSAKVMAPDVVTLRGAMFGLRVDRPRLFETNFPLHLDRVLVEGGRKLRRRCCMGARRRWRRRAPFGRPEELYCCSGNIFAVQGRSPMGVPHDCSEPSCSCGPWQILESVLRQLWHRSSASRRSAHHCSEATMAAGRAALARTTP